MKYAVPIVLFLVMDVAIGMLAFRLRPDRIDERSFRIESPLYHHDLKPGQSSWAQWGLLRYQVHTNSLGFKDATTREVPRESAARRVLLIGDSFTEGIGMSFEDSYAGLIAETLRARGIEALNAGVTSYSPVIYARKVRHLIEDVRLDFDEVVVFLDISDIEDEASHYMLGAEGRVIDQSPEATRHFHADTRPEKTRFERFKRFLVTHSLTLRVLDIVRERLVGPAPGSEAATLPVSVFDSPAMTARGNWPDDPVLFEQYGARGLARASESMDRLHDELAAAGKGLTLVVYPWPYQVVSGKVDSIQATYWRDWSAKRGVAFIDLFPTFVGLAEGPEQTLAEFYIQGDCHFNANGNRRFAEAFLEQFDPRPPPRARE